MAKKGRKWTADEKRNQSQAMRAVGGVREDMRAAGKPGDQSFGTAPGSLGIVKMQSEEARMGTCYECGYSSGRHGQLCSKYVPPDAA